jgi:hypothetical protein
VPRGNPPPPPPHRMLSPPSAGQLNSKPSKPKLRGASGLGARKGRQSYTPYGLKGLQIRGSRSPGGVLKGLEGPSSPGGPPDLPPTSPFRLRARRGNAVFRAGLRKKLNKKCKMAEQRDVRWLSRS